MLRPGVHGHGAGAAFPGNAAGAGRLILAGCLLAAPSAPAWTLAAATLAAAAVIDVRQRRIPNRLVAAAAAVAVLLGIAHGELACALGGATAAALPIGLCNLIRPGSLGAGDIKLAGVLGGLLGALHALWAVAAAVAAAAAYLALSRIAGRVAGPGPEIPLAPFLLAGLAVATITNFG